MDDFNFYDIFHGDAGYIEPDAFYGDDIPGLDEF